MQNGCDLESFEVSDDPITGQEKQSTLNNSKPLDTSNNRILILNDAETLSRGNK